MSGERGRVLIVEARFYEDVADALGTGAAAVLSQAGFAAERISVPGVFEIPSAMEMAKQAADAGPRRRNYVGYISLGCVIRGETDHYDHICRASSNALMHFSIRHAVPHGFGILTCENYAQAWERADVEQRNLGGRAANACLRMIEIKNRSPRV